MTLAGRYALVTGGSLGLGYAIAERLLRDGAAVMICGRDPAALAKARAKLADGGSPHAVFSTAADVADEASVDDLFVQIARDFPRLDILVNNAGVYGPMGALDDVDWREWVEAIRINLLGTVYCCRRALPMFRAQHYGKIINISGGGATNPLPRVTAYAASKAAIVRFSESLALECKTDGIDVNTVAPGALLTRLTERLIEAGPDRVGADLHARIKATAEKGGTPLEIGASLCAYLASSQSDGISGKLIAAQWDPWETLQDRREDLDGTDIYTLRRILPADRGKDWGER